MKAVVLHEKGGPESLRIEEFDTPQAGPGEVRGQTQSLGTEPARLLDHDRAVSGYDLSHHCRLRRSRCR